MEKMEKKYGTQEEKKGLFEVAQVTALTIEYETGVPFIKLPAFEQSPEIHTARILFAGILADNGIEKGKIAQLLRKKSDTIKAYVGEYRRLLNTSEKIKRITKEANKNI
jgi:hypothetical protein